MINSIKEKFLWFGDKYLPYTDEEILEKVEMHQALSLSEDVLFMMIQCTYKVDLSTHPFFWCECGGTYYIDLEMWEY